MANIDGRDRLTVKEKMLAVFDNLYQNAENDIMELDAKERMKLMVDLAKNLMPKSDIDAKDEKNNKGANTAAMGDYFGLRVDKKAI